MAKGSASSPTATPPAALKRTSSSAQNMKNQKSILGFFQKSSPATSSNGKPREPASSPAQRAGEARGASAVKPTPKRNFSSFAQDLTPVPSSDLPVPEEDEENGNKVKARPNVLLFPTSSPANLASSYQSGRDEIQDLAMTPSRRVCELYTPQQPSRLGTYFALIRPRSKSATRSPIQKARMTTRLSSGPVERAMPMDAPPSAGKPLLKARMSFRRLETLDIQMRVIEPPFAHRKHC